jgi:superfamily I DNA/RNA helicase
VTSFTPDQLAFIGERGHCIAVAGPGSGKTASLIEKIRRLAITPGVSVVAATFTSDAAEEMTHRLQRSMGRDPAASVSIGTWHSLALQHRKQFGLQQRTIGPGHQAKLLRRIVSARVPTHEVHTALLEFERIKCSLAAGDDAERPDWYGAYETELETLGAIDLYDAIRDTAQRMGNGQLPLLAATHLVIDEFQDNDEIQFALADLHAAAGVVTTMVGDDDQAIYEWRRARGFAGMQEFAVRHRARMLTLGDNFRSLGQIVSTSDKLIAHNIGFRTQKTFIARRGSGGSVKVMATSSLASASSTVVAGLETLLQPCADTGLVRSHVPTGAVAILARNNYMLDEAEAALLEVGAKYLRSSGSIWTSEPADLLMTLLATLVTNDPRGLDVALQLGGLPDGVISKVNAAFQGRVGDFLNDGTTFTNFAPYAPALEDVARRLRSIRDKLDARQFGSAIGSAAAFVRSTYRDHTLQNVRMLSILRAVASGLIAMRGPLVARLKEATTSSANQTATNAVVLATFHASKGQEFRNVFLLGVDEDIIPGKADIRAERRLLYVACTRAQDNLVITHTSGKGSCFLKELG